MTDEQPESKDEGHENIEKILKERDRLDKVLQERFTRRMTIVFSDVSGYTQYMDTWGDIRGRAWIQKHHDIVFPLIESHGGEILDVMGDGLMVAFKETLPAAKRILLREGFIPGRVLTTRSSLYEPGKVIAQDPSPYDELGEDKQITILLSMGVRNSANLIPDFVGRKISEVIGEIIERSRQGSFPKSRIRYVEHGGAQRGTVVAQAPAPGTEINPNHEIVKKLAGVEDEQTIEDVSRLLLEQALLIEGVELKDPAAFARRLNRFLTRAL